MTATYDVIGTGYDGSRRPDPRIADDLARLVQASSGAKVLDVGCGTGNYTRELAARGLAMTGLDPSDEMQRHLRFPPVLFPGRTGHRVGAVAHGPGHRPLARGSRRSRQFPRRLLLFCRPRRLKLAASAIANSGIWAATA